MINKSEYNEILNGVYEMAAINKAKDMKRPIKTKWERFLARQCPVTKELYDHELAVLKFKRDLDRVFFPVVESVCKIINIIRIRIN